MLDAHIVKARREFTVDVSLRLEPGAQLGIFGASGEGKSTILSCIAGLETPDAGLIRLDDRVLFPPSLPLHHRPIAYLTQRDRLFPQLTVGDNVCFGLGKQERIVQRAWLEELTATLGLGPLWNVAARHISGGQARRVALARMLARRPPLVLLDEPFAGLDRDVVRDLVQALLAWRAKLGFTLMVVDHQAEILERLGPRAVVIHRGRIIQQGTWDALRRAPATPLLERLLAAP